MDFSSRNVPSFDTIVIGAGPAGSEAALAAARSGARTLCLAINLDNVGFHPATPVLVDDDQDTRRILLEEMEILGGTLPSLIHQHEVTAERARGGGFGGPLVIDRRGLGLAYKEAVEAEEGVQLRQALVTSLEPVTAPDSQTGWIVTGNLGEKFMAPGVVVAAGTFLKGIVADGGDILPGGRRGEIPANALALWLQNLGLKMTEVEASSPSRLDSRSIGSNSMSGDFVTDGCQLGEVMASQIACEGNRCHQLLQIIQETGQEKAWMTRSAYRSRHLVLAAGQVGADLESLKHPGLFFAGRAAGSHSFTEAAALGFIAGKNAAAGALGRASKDKRLTDIPKYVDILCRSISCEENRPVTVNGQTR